MPTLPKEATEAPLEARAIREPIATATAAAGSRDALELQKRLSRRADLLKNLESKPSADEKPRGGDAWLERRLRTFERGMSALESRQEQVEASTRTALGAQDTTIKDLETAMAELRQRTGNSEHKVEAQAKEMRAALRQISLRLECLEMPSPVAAQEPPAELVAPVEAAPASEAEGKPEATQPLNADAVSSNADAPSKTALPSYLEHARKSAAEAHASTADREAEIASRLDRQATRRRRYVWWSLATVVLFAAAAGVSFSKGVYDGRRDGLAVVGAVSHLHRFPGSVAIARPEPSPLDRLTQRAQSGDAEAEMLVGERYLNGEGIAKSPVAALDWLKRAAVHGQPLAQYLLATLYQSGAAGAPDFGKSVEWYEAAALQGNRKAMHNLAVAYAQGQGVNKNLDEAVRWFSRAAQLGYVDSQFNLAILYERGAGVPQSLLDAYKWYSLAAREGDPEAKARAEAIRTQLNADDLAAAERAAASYQASPYSRVANVMPAG